MRVAGVTFQAIAGRGLGFIQSLGIAQGSCDDLHECAPCKNPLTGQPTGAPGCPP